MLVETICCTNVFEIRVAEVADPKVIHSSCSSRNIMIPGNIQEYDVCWTYSHRMAASTD